MQESAHNTVLPLPQRRAPNALFRFLASLKLAVLLMVTLAAVLAVATFLETKHGTPYAHWFIYKSSWFAGLLALLGVNIFCAAAVRYPFKRHQTGFVVTHIGLLVLLAGSLQTMFSGVEGRVTLKEGETATAVTLPEISQISAVWANKPKEAPYEFTFNGGPVNWSDRQRFDLGTVDGVTARVLKYYRQATAVTEWSADPKGGPVVKFRVTGPEGKVVAENSLADEQYGDALPVGPLRIQLQTAINRQMLEDFLTPATEPLPEQGTLLMYYQESATSVSVKDALQHKTPLGNTGVEVELVEYLPNAQPDKLGRFTTKGDQPKNPCVELRVHLPGGKSPLRQVAFARDALLNLDGVFPEICPVKFRYYHPSVKGTPSIELMQATDGTLHSRIVTEDKIQPHGVVGTGEKVAFSQNFELSVLEHQAHARRMIRWEPADLPGGVKAAGEPAALIEVTAAGNSQKLWLRRNDSQDGVGTVNLPSGTMIVRFESAQMPLGYSLKLEKFQRDMNPGGQGNAAFASRVTLVDEAKSLNEPREISMNQPLAHRRFTLYQSGFNDAGHNKLTSTFLAAYDPGRTLKYFGSLMICGGIAIMFYMKAYFFKRQATPRVEAPADQTADAATTMHSDHGHSSRRAA